MTASLVDPNRTRDSMERMLDLLCELVSGSISHNWRLKSADLEALVAGRTQLAFMEKFLANEHSLSGVQALARLYYTISTLPGNAESLPLSIVAHVKSRVVHMTDTMAMDRYMALLVSLLQTDAAMSGAGPDFTGVLLKLLPECLRSHPVPYLQFLQGSLHTLSPDVAKWLRVNTDWIELYAMSEEFVVRKAGTSLLAALIPGHHFVTAVVTVLTNYGCNSVFETILDPDVMKDVRPAVSQLSHASSRHAADVRQLRPVQDDVPALPAVRCLPSDDVVSYRSRGKGCRSAVL